jgi:hypothetical protein
MKPLKMVSPPGHEIQSRGKIAFSANQKPQAEFPLTHFLGVIRLYIPAQ